MTLLDRIVALLDEQWEPMSTVDVARQLGIRRTTARRVMTRSHRVIAVGLIPTPRLRCAGGRPTTLWVSA